MRKQNHTRFPVLILAVLALGLVICSAASVSAGEAYWMTTAGARLESVNLAVGASTTVHLVADVPANKQLTGFQFKLGFNPNIVTITDVAPADVQQTVKLLNGFAAAGTSQIKGSVLGVNGWSTTGVPATASSTAPTLVHLAEVTLTGAAAGYFPFTIQVDDFGTETEQFALATLTALNVSVGSVGATNYAYFIDKATMAKVTSPFALANGATLSLRLVAEVPLDKLLKAYSFSVTGDALAAMTTTSARLSTFSNGYDNIIGSVIKTNGISKLGVTGSAYVPIIDIELTGAAAPAYGTFTLTITPNAFNKDYVTAFLPTPQNLTIVVGTAPVTTLPPVVEVTTTTSTTIASTTTTVEGATTTTVEGATTTTTVGPGPVVTTTTTKPVTTTTTIPSGTAPVITGAVTTGDPVVLTPTVSVQSVPTGTQVAYEIVDSTGTVVYKETSLTGQFSIPALLLDAGSQEYTVKASFVDAGGTQISEWTSRTFKTVAQSPGDTDNDGTPDSQLVSKDVNSRTLSTPQGGEETVTGGTAITGAAINPAPNMPCGAITFSAVVTPGSTETFVIDLCDVPPAGSYWTDDEGYLTPYSAAIDGKKATLTITDGGPGDLDGVKNGVILVGPAGVYLSVTPTTVPGVPGMVYEDNDNCFISTLLGK